MLDPHVDQPALAADALTVENVELRLPERWSAIVDHHLLCHQVVQLLHFHIESLRAAGRFDPHDLRIGDLLGKDVTKKLVVKCISQAGDAVAS